MNNVVPDRTQYFETLIADVEALLRVDPAAAGVGALALQLELAEEEMPAVLARCIYLRAQAAATVGNFPAALDLIGEAQARYVRAGLQGAAARTNLGRIHVLNEMGRHDAALDACDTLLAALAAQPDDLEQSDLLALSASAHLNRGACCRMLDRYSDALDSYRIGEDLFRLLGRDEARADVINNRGLVLFSAGRIDEAVLAFRESLEIYERADLSSNRVRVLDSLAEAELARGRYAVCLDVLAEANALLNDLETPLVEQARGLVAARAYEALNLHPEAVATYTAAERFCSDAGMTVDRARARSGCGRAHAALGERDQAASFFDAVIDDLSQLGERRWLATALVDRAVLEHDQDPSRAEQHVREAIAIATAAGAPMERVHATVTLADMTASVSEGAALLQAAREQAASLDLAPVHFLVDRAVGLNHLRLSEYDAARSCLERAASLVEVERQTLRVDAVASMFVADKLDVFDGLVQLELAQIDVGTNGPQRVLAATERARSRALTDMTLGLIDRTTSTTVEPYSAYLTHELNAVYAELFEEKSATRATILSARASALERDLKLREVDGSRQHARAGQASASFAGSTEGLVSDIPMLSWYCLEDQVVGCVEFAGSVSVEPVLATLSDVRRLTEELSLHWERLRLDPQMARRHASRLERSCRSVLQGLYDLLFGPLERYLPSSDTVTPLVVLPHGLLHGLPVQAFHDGERYLIDRFEISYVPSRHDYALRQAMTARQGEALVLGAPDELAPDVIREAIAVATQLHRATLRTGPAATASALLTEGSSAGLIHVACHAMYRVDNPMFSGLRLHDRWVTARELLAVDLSGAMVTLSACDSARAFAVRGEELLGLTRAVLGAGARTLVAAQWSADDEATTELMSSFYQHLSELGPAGALRAAQLEQRERFIHPNLWAAFIVVGGR